MTMDQMLGMTISEAVKALWLVSGLQQKDFAAAVGLTPRAIQRYIQGFAPNSRAIRKLLLMSQEIKQAQLASIFKSALRSESARASMHIAGSGDVQEAIEQIVDCTALADFGVHLVSDRNAIFLEVWRVHAKVLKLATKGGLPPVFSLKEIRETHSALSLFLALYGLLQQHEGPDGQLNYSEPKGKTPPKARRKS